jgi:hypothetical protein
LFNKKHYKIEYKNNPSLPYIEYKQSAFKMEKRLNRISETYITNFKNNIRDKILEINFDEKTKINELMEFIYDYERLAFVKEDFIKRKRVKNSIPSTNRCNARRANGEQCTRRRKDNCEFCGTHSKGVPHGFMEEEDMSQSTQKLEVFAEDVQGIVYYIDKFNNVYKTEDIISGKENPDIIAKCIKNSNGYSIPSLGL